MSERLYKPGDVWYGWYYNRSNKRVRFSTYCKDRDAALAVIAKRERQEHAPMLEPPEEVKAEKIYFIRAGEDGPIKIGRTCDIARRMRTMQTGNHMSLRLVGWVYGGPALEAELHKQFHCVSGEWFTASGELISRIEQLSALLGCRLG